MAASDDLAAQADRLRAEVERHKAAIRYRLYATAGERRRLRSRLGDAKTRLMQLEAECRRLGIGFYHTQPGAGD